MPKGMMNTTKPVTMLSVDFSQSVEEISKVLAAHSPFTSGGINGGTKSFLALFTEESIIRVPFPLDEIAKAIDVLNHLRADKLLAPDVRPPKATSGVRCPKCRKGFMIPNPNWPDLSRSCDQCGHHQIRCENCGNWAKQGMEGLCVPCQKAADREDRESEYM